VIYAFDVENESQGYMTKINSEWVCGRASVLKSLIQDPTILVSTGGGVMFSDSLSLSHFTCPYVDIVSVHSYESLSKYPSQLELGTSLIHTLVRMIHNENMFIFYA
jgi:hypothetical protein